MDEEATEKKEIEELEHRDEVNQAKSSNELVEDRLKEKLKRQQEQYCTPPKKTKILETAALQNEEIARLTEDQTKSPFPTPPKGKRQVKNSPLITRVDKEKGGLFGTLPL